MIRNPETDQRGPSVRGLDWSAAAEVDRQEQVRRAGGQMALIETPRDVVPRPAPKLCDPQMGLFAEKEEPDARCD